MVLAISRFEWLDRRLDNLGFDGIKPRKDWSLSNLTLVIEAKAGKSKKKCERALPQPWKAKRTSVHVPKYLMLLFVDFVELY